MAYLARLEIGSYSLNICEKYRREIRKEFD
jgi:hypothetical protein